MTNRPIYIGAIRTQRRRWINWDAVIRSATWSSLTILCVVVWGLAIYGGMRLTLG